MDNQNVFPPFQYSVTCLTIVAVEVLASFLGNGFIMAVNLLDWLKNKSLNPTDYILFLLAFSNAGLSYIYGNYIFFIFTWSQFYMVDYAFPVTFAVLILMTLSSSWLIAWLCLYFCFKIIHFKSSFLVKIKASIDSTIFWLILISQVTAFSYSIPLIWSFSRPLTQNVTFTQNVSQIVPFKLNDLYYILAFGTSSHSATIIVIVSLVSIIWSLCRHTYKMKKIISPEDKVMLQTHIHAAKIILSLLLLYVLFCLSVILTSSAFSSTDFGILYWCTIWVLMGVSPAYSVVLILGNSKLRLMLQKILSKFIFKKPV